MPVIKYNFGDEILKIILLQVTSKKEKTEISKEQTLWTIINKLLVETHFFDFPDPRLH